MQKRRRFKQTLSYRHRLSEFASEECAMAEHAGRLTRPSC
ncbi:hypothetical protein J2S34_002265 [Nitrobacter winogradskyi]|uniref:Uncharacterized protein n=1 Tax=Nitrobacter winogradskyi TaxID=913 RepID=A0ACC6AIX1_NITWI|nr:hypothetical protein [Nitrobacter winogradskyi]